MPRIKFKKQLQEYFDSYLTTEEKQKLPKGWAKIGTISLVKIDPTISKYQIEIGKFIIDHFPYIKTVYRSIEPIKGVIRKPKVEFICGEQTSKTIHKELGTKFALDIQKVMFSRGNHFERKRMIEIIPPKIPLQIIDMFACVGNLSLPIAVHRPQACRILAIDINPVAYNLLKQSIALNHLKGRYQAKLGNNIDLIPEDFADKVIMGYFDISDNQISAAIASLKEKTGGVLHIHYLIRRRESPNIINRINQIIEKEHPCKSAANLLRTMKIKSFNPAIEHYVADIKIK